MSENTATDPTDPAPEPVETVNNGESTPTEDATDSKRVSVLFVCLGNICKDLTLLRKPPLPKMSSNPPGFHQAALPWPKPSSATSPNTLPTPLSPTSTQPAPAPTTLAAAPTNEPSKRCPTTA